MIFPRPHPHRLHTHTNLGHTQAQSIHEKTFYSKHPLSQPDRPLLSFTSFQHYLEDSNQTLFHLKQHEKLHRSTQKAKTQAHFNYQRQKTESDNKNAQIKPFHLEDSIILNPFHPSDSHFILNKTNKPHRNINSKSSSDHYLPQGRIAEDIFNEKYCTIQGWNEQQKIYDLKQSKFVSSQSILQQKKLNSIIKNRNLKSSQNSFKKPPKPISLSDSNDVKKTNPITEPISSQKKLKKKQSSNKQNICLTQTSLQSSPHHQDQDSLFRPIQLKPRQNQKKHPLTSINQLEQQILLSKRQPNFLSSFSGLYDQNQTHNLINVFQQNENIKMLKKQFEYLCKDDLDQNVAELEKTPLSSINANNSSKTINKQIKYFKRFPNHQNKQNTANPSIDTVLKTNRPKTTNDDTTSSMLKILQSINHTTSNQKCLYQTKTPVKKKFLTQTNLHTPKKDDMKHISKQKEKFHDSIKDRKSKSAFHYTNGFCLNQSYEGKQNDACEYERRQNPLVITVMGSFKSCDSKTRSGQKWNSKNLYLLKNKNPRILSVQETTQNQKSTSSLFDKDFLPQSKITQSSELKDDQNFNDLRINQSMSQTIDILNSASVNQENFITEENQSMEQLNLLSQQLKKCAKIPATSKYINQANKKFMYLNRAGRVNINKDKERSGRKEEAKNVIKNLTITQLEGRHIEKLRKRIDLNDL